MDANHHSIYHDQIDAYLRDELSIEEKALFEQSLKNNPELLHEFRIHQELFALTDESVWINESFIPSEEEVKEVETYFRSTEAKKLKNTIAQAQINYQKGNRFSFFNNRLFLPILAAASIALIVILYTFNSNNSTRDLYVEHSRWKDLPSLTSRSDENQLAEGQKMFEQKKYQESYSLFKNYVENNDQTSPSVLVYVGLSALELNKYEEAISYFDRLISSDAVDQSKGYWYKALVYLKQDNEDRAILILENILLDEQNYNFNKAKVLLKKMQ
ncbi:TPR repeat-containing protein [Aquimarina amphilecti]|uniref:TPR repeat-containing protein n=1 Tax=Aquimarina amphilecti TaxID=1038014 RepID=A0A1H7WGV0_AQUAM|nr:tetratricopeptide repeat protein [Aquimarina amphilecti]SEM20258.1 TPR repeat-containing protein [Aquimarina amphilecti]